MMIARPRRELLEGKLPRRVNCHLELRRRWRELLHEEAAVVHRRGLLLRDTCTVLTPARCAGKYLCARRVIRACAARPPAKGPASGAGAPNPPLPSPHAAGAGAGAGEAWRRDRGEEEEQHAQ